MSAQTKSLINLLFTVNAVEYCVWHLLFVAVARQRYIPPSRLLKLLMVSVDLREIKAFKPLELMFILSLSYLVSVLTICPLCSHVYEPIVGGLEPPKVTSQL